MRERFRDRGHTSTSSALLAIPWAAMTVHLPDGKQLELEDGATGPDAARAIGEGLARAALAIKVDGEMSDLERAASRRREDRHRHRPLRRRGARGSIRHDAAHVLAKAVIELYPGTKVSIGPPIDDGFYYDFEFPEGVSVSDSDLERSRRRCASTSRPTSTSSAPN